MEKQNGTSHISNGEPKQFIDKRNVELEDASQMSPEQKRKEKIYITKNVVIISGGFLFLFTAFQSLQNLQSSLNADKGMWSI